MPDSTLGTQPRACTPLRGSSLTSARPAPLPTAGPSPPVPLRPEPGFPAPRPRPWPLRTLTGCGGGGGGCAEQAVDVEPGAGGLLSRAGLVTHGPSTLLLSQRGRGQCQHSHPSPAASSCTRAELSGKRGPGRESCRLPPGESGTCRVSFCSFSSDALTSALPPGLLWAVRLRRCV